MKQMTIGVRAPLWITLLGAVLLASCGGEPYEEELRERAAFSTQLSSTQVARYAKNAGVPCGERLRKAVAVAYAESGYKPTAKNVNSNGTVDQGLWQINSYYHPSKCSYYNPVCNAAAMARISSRGSSWKAWYGYGTSRFWTAYHSHAKTGAARACSGASGASSASGASGAALSSPFVFDAAFYLLRYADLRSSYGSNRTLALRHWLNHGIKEGRQAAVGFSVRDYLSRYSDLKGAFGTNYEAAAQHWLSHGIKEGRRTSRAFDVRHYLSRHGDLRKAFGDKSYKAAIDHWLSHGIKEGRQTASDFSVKAYLGRYADLRAAFGSNYRSAFYHWFRHGAKEGRNPNP